MGRLPFIIESELQRLSEGSAGRYRVYSTERDTVVTPHALPGFDYRAEMEALRPHVAGLRRRLLQTLMGRVETRWLGDQERGSLDPRSLHRLATGLPVQNLRTRVESDAEHTACTLLLDISSSMNGRAIGLCRQLALAFAETLDMLGFPTEIIGFSTVERDVRREVSEQTGIPEEELSKRFARFVPLYHAIYKAFGEPWRTAAGRFGSMQTKSLTPLGESLLFAGKRLSTRPEKRKVLFCLTDGKPIVGAWDEHITFAHACEAVKVLSSAGIEPVGIGILKDCVQEIFPSHAVIHDFSDLPRGFLQQLHKVLVRQ